MAGASGDPTRKRPEVKTHVELAEPYPTTEEVGQKVYEAATDYNFGFSHERNPNELEGHAHSLMARS